MHETVRARFHKKSYKNEGTGALLEDEVGKGARDWSWLAVAASWQAHHHLNPNVYHIIIK